MALQIEMDSFNMPLPLKVTGSLVENFTDLKEELLVYFDAIKNGNTSG